MAAPGTGIRHFVLAMTGSAVNVATALGLSKGGDISAEPACSEIHFEAFAANAAACYFGNTGSGVASTNYGFSLPAGSTHYSKVIGGSYESGRLKLSSLDVNGANGEKVAITVVTR